MAKINIKHLTPALAIHPGEHLDDELFARKIDLVGFAKQSGVPFRTLVAIIMYQQDITPDVAIKIARSLGMAPEIWLNFQTNYERDLTQIRKTKEH